MKKLLAALLCLSLALTAVGCGGVDDESGGAEQGDTQQTSAEDLNSSDGDSTSDNLLSDNSLSDNSQSDSSQSDSSQTDESTADSTADDSTDDGKTDGADAPIDEQTLTDRFYAQIEAVKNNDLEAFSEAFGADAYRELAKSSFLGDSEVSDSFGENVDAALDETMAELMQQMLDGYSEMYEQLDVQLSGPLKNIEWKSLDEADASLLGTDMPAQACLCYFSVHDDISDTDMPYNLTAIGGSGGYVLIFTPGEYSPAEQYADKTKLVRANSNAKTVYTCVIEFITEEEANGRDGNALADEITGEIDLTNINALSGRIKDVGEMLTERTGFEGQVYIICDRSDGDDGYGIYIQYRNDENSVIGQYPDLVPDNSCTAVWGKKFDTETADRT